MTATGLTHLVVQTGHNRQPVFLGADDRHAYREALGAAAIACGVSLHAYALATDRVLLLATPHHDGAISRMMQRIGHRYTAEFNRRHGRTGTLWDGRFRAAVVEAATWLLPAMQHVEAAAQAEAGSAPHHRGERPDPLITDHPGFWALGNTPFERQAAYALLSGQPLDPGTRGRLEHAMLHGWALGTDAFLGDLAGRLSRPVRPRRPGRPSRSAAKGSSPTSGAG